VNHEEFHFAFQAVYVILLPTYMQPKGVLMAMMIRAYTGQIERGRFIADSPSTKLPDMCRVIINILDDECVAPTRTNSRRQKEALGRLYSGLAAIDNEPLDAEFDAAMNQRFNIGRELSL
jgi:hypothetical protein